MDLQFEKQDLEHDILPGGKIKQQKIQLQKIRDSEFIYTINILEKLSLTSPSVEGSMSEYRESQIISSTFFMGPVEIPGNELSQS